MPVDLPKQHELTLRVNGADHQLHVGQDVPLLYVLRNDLELNSPKYGCGLGQCGACSVLMDGVSRRSCLVPAHAAVGKEIRTLEGLGTVEKPHPVQRAFIEAQAAQCGYCLNGMIISTVSLLNQNPKPTDVEAREALSHNLCRCGTHIEILEAVSLAALFVSQAESKNDIS